VAYVHSKDTVEKVLKNKTEYEKLLIDTIKEYMEWE
jgi:hypothetical protein